MQRGELRREGVEWRRERELRGVEQGEGSKEAGCHFSVLTVSSNCLCEGEMLAIITVRQLPPSESLSSLVIFESRKGTWPLLFLSASAVMQLPSARRERLMLAPCSEGPIELLKHKPSARRTLTIAHHGTRKHTSALLTAAHRHPPPKHQRTHT